MQNTKNAKLKKQRSISPRKISKDEIDLYKSVEKLSTIKVSHQRGNNPEYTRTLQRIIRKIEDIKRNSAVSRDKHAQQQHVSVIRKKWVHKPFT
jgi:hypothetical protein